MIAFLTLELHIEAAQSLKDKRQVVRSLKDRLRNSFNISIAEIEVTDLWQRATLGVVSISGSRDYLEGLMRNVEQAATRQANNSGDLLLVKSGCLRRLRKQAIASGIVDHARVNAEVLVREYFSILMGVRVEGVVIGGEQGVMSLSMIIAAKDRGGSRVLQ